MVPRLETFDGTFLNKKVCEVFCSKDLQMLLIYMLDMSILKGNILFVSASSRQALLAEGSKQVVVLYGTSDLVLYGTLQMNFIFRPL